MPRKKMSRFYRMLMMMLMLPVFGLMAIPDGDGGGTDGGDGGGTPPDDKDKSKAPPAGNDDDTSKTHVPREEFNKVVEQRQKAKEQAQSLQKQIDELKKTSGDATKMQEELNTLKERDKRLQELEKLEEERKTKDMTEIDRLKHEREKLTGQIGELQTKVETEVAAVRGELTKQIEQLTAQNAKLQQHKLSSEIISAAAANGAHNPSVLVKLLGDEFKLNDDGEYIAEVPGPKGGLSDRSVEERVKDYLAVKDNAYLLKPGAGPRRANEPGDGGPENKDKTKNAKLTEAERREAKMRGMSETEYYDIVVAPREKRMTEVREDRKAKGGMLPGQLKLADR